MSSRLITSVHVLCALLLLLGFAPTDSDAQETALTWDQVGKLRWRFVNTARPELRFSETLRSPSYSLMNHLIFQKDRTTCALGDNQVETLTKATRIELERRLNHAMRWFRDKQFPPPQRLPIGPAYSDLVWYLDTTDPYALIAGCKAADTFGVQYRCSAGQHSEDNNLIAFGSALNRAYDDPDGSPAYLAAASTHELGHLFTAGAMEGPLRCKSTTAVGGDWVTEGIADALMLDYVDETFPASQMFKNGVDNRLETRFYLHRPAWRPLDWYPPSASIGIANHDAKNIQYATGSFWLHVMQRYLNDQYAPLAALVEQVHRGEGIGYIDTWLDQMDGSLMGLETAYAQYVGELAQYHKWRFNKRLRRTRAHKLAFDGCQTLAPTVNKIDLVALELAPFSARCVEIRPSKNEKLPFTLNVRTSTNGTLADDVYVSLAEMTGLGGDFDCYKSGQRNPGAPCVLKPIQFRNDDAFTREYVWTDRVAAYTQPPLIRLIISYIPKTMEPTQQNYAKQTIQVNVGTAMSSVTLNGKPAATAETWGGRELGHALYLQGELASGVATAMGFSLPGDALSDLNTGDPIATDTRLNGFVVRSIDDDAVIKGIGDADRGFRAAREAAAGPTGTPFSVPVEAQILVSVLDGKFITPGLVTTDGPLNIEARANRGDVQYIRFHKFHKPGGVLFISENSPQRIRFSGSVKVCEHPPGYIADQQPRLGFLKRGKRYVYDSNGNCQTNTEEFEFSGAIAWPNYAAFENQLDTYITENMMKLYRFTGAARPGAMYGPWAEDRGKLVSVFSMIPIDANGLPRIPKAPPVAPGGIRDLLKCDCDDRLALMLNPLCKVKCEEFD